MTKPTPKEYQKTGIDFLVNNGTEIPYHSILGDDMGLGKTAQAILATQKVNAKKLLVICPSTVKINWMREIFKWSDYKNIFMVGKYGKIPAKDCVIDSQAEVVIINYDLCILPKIKKQLSIMSFDVCILDECHYLMNKTSGRTKAILSRGGIIWRCKYKWALSGTFMKNRNRDCFAILRSLFPHALGKYREYLSYAERFCGGKQGAFGYDDTSSTNTEELGQILSKVMLRRTKAEVMKELPELTEQNIYLDHTAEIIEALKMESEFTEEQKNSFLALQELGATATYRKTLAMAKINQCTEHIKNMMNEINKVTIFAYHRDFISLLAEKLAPYGVEIVRGGMSPEQKQKSVDNFVNDPNTRIFIGQIQAAGTGLDGLQLVCSDVVFAEIDWVPGTVDQARDRCYRMGQKKSTHIQYLLVSDSLEDGILNAVRNKRHNIKSVMQQVEKIVETKGEKTMTLESNLERIAVALEKIVEAQGTHSCKCVTSAVEPIAAEAVAVAPQKPKAKSKAKAPTETQKVVAEVVTEAVAQAAPQVMTPAAAPATVTIQKCMQEAEVLKGLIGETPATTYIREVTAQITGIAEARVATCTPEQLAAVHDAIIAKVQEIQGSGI